MLMLVLVLAGLLLLFSCLALHIYMISDLFLYFCLYLISWDCHLSFAGFWTVSVCVPGVCMQFVTVKYARLC